MRFSCETCPAGFNTQAKAVYHMNQQGHWQRYECETCDADFTDEEDCDEHMQDYDHWARNFECDSCYARFRTQRSCEQHMDMKDHWEKPYECEGCYECFRTHAARKQHMYEEDHFMNHRCNDCDRGFESKANLNEHLTGRAHLANSMKCPYCSRTFTRASGVAHHLEQGACSKAPGLNVEKIYKGVRQIDTQGVITKKLLTWPGEVSYTATTATWNGSAYECYICHNDFNSLRALDQHINSPKHKQHIYHCFGKKCNKQFKALAQLFAHLESESCGAMKFKNVQSDAKAVLSGRPGQKLLAY